MAEVFFYHLTTTALEAALPPLLERSLARGWRALVRLGSAERVAAMDHLLWTWRDDSFLPHATLAEGHAQAQPILLTDQPGPAPNGAQVLFVTDEAPFDPADAIGFARVCLLFDGGVESALQVARTQWRLVEAAGLPATYWAQAEHGGWVRKAQNQHVPPAAEG